MKHYYIFTLTHGNIVNHGDRVASIEQLQTDFPASDGWLVIPAADLPADFSVDTYTIENGQPVRASDEQIAERKAAATLAYNEGQRQLRETEYRATTDPPVIDAIAESTPEIKALKDAIRAKHPYRS